MTRKRFIKLLMSQGYDRNGANAMADIVRAKNQPYAVGYEAAKVSKQLVIDLIPSLSEIIRPIVETVQQIAKAFSAGFEAFGRAYRNAMSETE